MGKPATIDDKLAGTRWFFYTHPVVHRLHGAVVDAIKTYAAGRTLDAGAGKLAYRSALVEHGAGIEYVSLDMEPCHEALDVIADFAAGTDFPEEHFDTVFCSQVLEHTPDPGAFLDEAYRVLKTNGRLIVTTPFLFYLHGLPNDFFRYTPNGLALLVNRSGFTIIKQSGAGGLLAFVAMVFFVALFHAIRFLPVWCLIPLLLSVVPFSWLDAALDTSSRFPANVIVVAEKR